MQGSSVKFTRQANWGRSRRDGEVAFKGEVLRGEQAAIVEREMFDAVQAKLSEQANNHKATRMKSEALLAGRIFDDAAIA